MKKEEKGREEQKNKRTKERIRNEGRRFKEKRDDGEEILTPSCCRQLFLVLLVLLELLVLQKGDHRPITCETTSLSKKAAAKNHLQMRTSVPFWGVSALTETQCWNSLWTVRHGLLLGIVWRVWGASVIRRPRLAGIYGVWGALGYQQALNAQQERLRERKGVQTAQCEWRIGD